VSQILVSIVPFPKWGHQRKLSRRLWATGDKRPESWLIGHYFLARNHFIFVPFPSSLRDEESLEQEVQMTTRIATAVAFILILASQAFADCNQELKILEQKVISAETGASPSETGMAATKHQEELLAGKQKSGAPETTGTTARALEPASPHQEQVTGKRSVQGGEHATQMIVEARKMSEAGDEQGCMKKAAELKDMLGAK
jgi:hypothetical protein